MYRSWRVSIAMLFASVLGASLSAEPPATLLKAVEQRSDEGWKVARQIWNLAEPGYQESQSSALLADWLEREGFRVERGVAGMPTAFVASIGSGEPVIAILGEYDALPGLSQTDQPAQQSREGASYGHGCGHHLFGVASLMAAVAVGEQIKSGAVSGTVRYYGCPAEEGGSAKAFMVREGLFRDVSAALHWHPSSRNSAGDSSSLARIALKFRFQGKSAHASSSPEEGRSSLDAVELTAHASELLREHIPSEARIHHVITRGGHAPNVTPDDAEVYFYIRHPRASVVAPLAERLIKCAQGAALATETELEVIREGGIVEILPNTILSEAVMRHLQTQNTLHYSEAEVQFALKLQSTLGNPESLEQIREISQRQNAALGRGSTDVGDVSWAVPTAGFTSACWVPGTPGHSWQAVASGGTTIGRQGMNMAARTLTLSMYELLTSPVTLNQAREEHRQRIAERRYTPLILPDQKPPLDYRKTGM